jgi:disulfide bond formation protein DsbB
LDKADFIVIAVAFYAKVAAIIIAGHRKRKIMLKASSTRCVFMLEFKKTMIFHADVARNAKKHIPCSRNNPAAERK